jgi:hypothetical protein
LTAFVHPVRRTGADHLVDRISEFHFNVFSFACNPHIRTAQLAQKIKRWLRLLAQRKPQRVILASLPGGFLDVLGQPVKPVRGAAASDTLMRPLVIVIGNPISQPLACVCKGGKDGFLQKLLPDRLPEPLDLAQRHGMLRCASNVADPLALEYLLEACLTPPGSKLPAVVRQDLPRRAPLAHGSLDYLEHGLGCLLPEKPVPYDIARVIVDDPHQVDRVEALELEGKDVDLP